MVLIADAGLPMISIFLPAAWLALIPIILIETAIGVRLTKITYARSACAAAAANLFSTLLGIPLTWMVMALVELRFFGTARGLDSPAGMAYAVTIQSPWLIPYRDALIWMVPIAAVVLAVPFCLVSIISEYFIVRRILRTMPAALAWRWMWRGNLASYAMLLLLMAVLPLLGPPVDRLHKTLEPVTDLLIETVFKLV